MKFQFLHIEKTAGMTMHRILHRDYFNYVSPDPRKIWNPDTRMWPIRHFNNGGHSIQKSSRFDYQFTILREPLARYISHFNWRANVMGESWSFDDYLAMDEFSDFQSKKICNYTNCEVELDALKEFTFVGIMEHFDRTLTILGRDIGLKTEYRRENIKKYSSAVVYDKLTPEVQKVCIANNQRDLRLYQAATELFSTTAGNETDTKVRTIDFSFAVKVKQKLFNLATRDWRARWKERGQR